MPAKSEYGNVIQLRLEEYVVIRQVQFQKHVTGLMMTVMDKSMMESPVTVSEQKQEVADLHDQQILNEFVKHDLRRVPIDLDEHVYEQFIHK